MRTIFVNHSERLSVTKNNPEWKRYLESKRRCRENDRASAMSTAFILVITTKKQVTKSGIEKTGERL